MIRLKSRVLNQEFTAEYLYHFILPSSHILVERMISEYHLDQKHVGTQALLAILRDKVWILKGRKTVGRVLQMCIYCKLHSAKSLDVSPPPLPADRTGFSSCSQVTEIDLAGPLVAREGQKC